MIPVLLTIKKETLIEDHIKIVLIRQIVSEIIILEVTTGILTKNLEKQTLSTRRVGLPNVDTFGSIYHWKKSCPDSYQ